VGGVPKRVLVQLFERRVLTFTSSNLVQYQIEFGNIGQHYYHWRYIDSTLPDPTPTPTPSPTPIPTPTQPGPQYPTEGNVVYETDLSDVGPYTSQDGYVQGYWDATTASYLIEDATPPNNQGSGLIIWWQSSTDAPADYSVTIDIVTLTTDSTFQSEVGIYTRLESSNQLVTEVTHTGLGMDGMVGSWYLGPDDAVLLADYEDAPLFNSGYGAINQLKVIVVGNRAWVFLNNQFVQEFNLDARSDPLANGFSFFVLRNPPADQAVTRFGFRNLVVREAH
jgi:hypothetical protein